MLTATSISSDAAVAAAETPLTNLRAAWLVTALAAAGALSVWGAVKLLWTLWTEDPLKSIGGLVPAVSLLLMLRIWKATGFTMRGSWWGLAVLIATVALVHVRDGAVLEFVLTPSYTIFLPPLSLMAVLYAGSIALLFGGWRLVRAGWFPLLFMALVNPVPHVFTRLVDLPLQHASSATARAFAHMLGQRLTPDQLYLMFTPDFGMFIAPGCNGIRGAVTMALIALVAGHLYRFRARAWALMVAAALLLGYVFNLLRLCVLVLFYLVALHVPALRSHATGTDYAIGACLFFAATVLLFAAIRRWGTTRDLRLPEPVTEFGKRAARADIPSAAEAAFHRKNPTGGSKAPPLQGEFRLRLAAFVAVLALGSASYVRGMLHPRPALAASEAAGLFPRQAGPYRLQRTWDERFSTGALLFHWAEYAASPKEPSVSIGVAPEVGAHDSLLCHVARGEDWLWKGTLTLPTAGGEAVAFSGSFFQQATDYLEATTVCTGGRCGQISPENRRFGLVYSRPGAGALLIGTRPIPVLLRAETTETALPPDTARAELTAALQQFAAAIRLDDLTRPYEAAAR